ncbi:MAG TPA: carboxypeptidase-like regulatory domain-containing protein [Bacilli bacterium]|nr:carboxypeptidase-like regulatory domain-containing protein [Bacilli bacterium]
MIKGSKGKWILGLLVLLVVAAAAGAVYYPSYLMKRADALREEGKPLAALELYERVFEDFPIHPQAPNALLQAADLGPKEFADGSVYVFAGGMYSATTQAPVVVTAEQSIVWLKKLQADYPDSSEAKQVSPSLLVTLYALTGRKADAQSLLTRYPEFRSEYDRAVHFAEGDAISGETQLQGRVLLGDKPISGQHVYLREKSDNTFTSTMEGVAHVVTDADGVYRFSGLQPGDYEVGIRLQPSEMDGYFWPAEYEDKVAIREQGEPPATWDIRFKRGMKMTAPEDGAEIEGDEITFRWEPEPNAAYYTIGITGDTFDKTGKVNGSLGVYVNDHITGTEVTYSIEELRGKMGGLSFHAADDPDYTVIDAASVLGLIYPGGTFAANVHAFDAQGDLLNSSERYTVGTDERNRPVFTLDDEEQLEGDRLLMKGQYEAAVESYLQEGDNPNALRSLAILAYYGTKTPNGKGMHNPVDPEQAIKYLERVPRLTDRDKQLLADSYRAAGQMDKTKVMYCREPKLFEWHIKRYEITCD